jgi:group I intron endonuclease
MATKKANNYINTELDWSYANFSGIYKLTNLVNNKFYIGSARDLYKRASDHFCKLRKGIHKNPHLQASYNKYGNVFKFEVIKLIVNNEELFKAEQYFIDELNPQYNINRKATGHYIKHTIEARRKISESQYKTVIQYTRDGVYIREFPSVKSVLELYNNSKKTGHLSDHIKGIYKYYKGFIYKYK